jgi:hypothetical protein
VIRLLADDSGGSHLDIAGRLRVSFGHGRP